MGCSMFGGLVIRRNCVNVIYILDFGHISFHSALCVCGCVFVYFEGVLT